MKHRQFIITFGIALLLLGAACQKKTPAATPANNDTVNGSITADPVPTNTAAASTVDPCSLITRNEAEGIFGRTAAEPVRKGTTCRYDTADTTKFFDLLVRSGIDADFETMKGLCGSTLQPVTGLGASSCSANNTVVVLTKGILMSLIAGGVFDQGQLKDLVVTASGRIP